MITKPLVGVALVAALLSTSSLALAAAAPGPKARIFAKFDTNKNAVIDGDEIAAVRAAYVAEPKGDLARFDGNTDGKLDDAEIALIKPPGARNADKKGEKKAGEKKNGGKKKADVEAKTDAAK